jgi:hypothetical protein
MLTANYGLNDPAVEGKMFLILPVIKPRSSRRSASNPVTSHSLFSLGVQSD